MRRPNTGDAGQLLRARYGADPAGLADMLVLTDASQLSARRATLPGVRVEPLRLSAAELDAEDWKALIGMVLGRDIASRIQVSIKMIPTLPTDEYRLRTAVVAGTMPTAATSLRGMSRIDRNHRTTRSSALYSIFALRLANGHECRMRFV